MKDTRKRPTRKQSPYLLLGRAKAVADDLMNLLRSSYHRMEPVGGLAKERKSVTRLEFLVDPILMQQTDLFGTGRGLVSLLDQDLAKLESLSRIRKDGPSKTRNERRLIFRATDGRDASIILHICPPGRWDVIKERVNR